MKHNFILSLIHINLILYIFLIRCGPASHIMKMNSSVSFNESFIRSPGIKLHYLDWGGPGQPLILIHGLGDSPYIFQDFAASLSPRFRVIAYSRRSHCKSDNPGSGYDTFTLTSDLKLLLDSLSIDKANLLGWSMGGNEITEFAIRYPERTNKLIYFEAGYDLSEPAFEAVLKTIPTALFGDSLVLSSLGNYRSWYHQFWFPDMDWNPTLEENLKASIQINPDSSITTLPNDSLSKLILKTAMNYHREYDKIKVPALVIFTNSFFKSHAQDKGIINLYDNLEKEIIGPWRIHSINRINKELKNSTILKVPHGSHTSFLFKNKNLLEDSITDFLLD